MFYIQTPCRELKYPPATGLKDFVRQPYMHTKKNVHTLFNFIKAFSHRPSSGMQGKKNESTLGRHFSK